ncbi:MAG: hypothetical protein ABWY35_04820 [Pseudorhodoplanes sp.]
MANPLLVAPFVVMLAMTPAAAQFAGPTIAKPGAPQTKASAAEKPAKTCPEYGAGYVRLDNGICVKIGGYVRMEGGTR